MVGTADSGIKEPLTATGSTKQVHARSGAFQISGTFAGTVQLQRRMGDNWQVLAEYTAPTATGNDVSFDNGVAVLMRFECTAFTSGSIDCVLVANREST